MKKIILGLLLTSALALPAAGKVEARPISDLAAVEFSDDIAGICDRHDLSGLDGCYWGGNVRRIYIRADLDPNLVSYVLAHELGHFYMEGTTEAEYNRVFFPGMMDMPKAISQEMAADYFAFWLLYPGLGVSKEINQFFLNAISR